MLRSRKLIPAFVLSLAITPVVQSAITVNGVLDVSEGYTRYAVQTNNTSFDNNTVADGTSSGGSELNAAYGKVEGSNLHLFFSGNLKNDFSHLNVFIADGRAGQNTINVSGTLGAMNTSKFSPGFQATYALDLNGGGGPFTEYVNEYTMTAPPASGYLGSFTPNTGSPFTFANGVSVALDNTNVAGVAGGAPSAAITADAEAVTTGFEIAIPLSKLGNPTGGDLKVVAMLNGGNDAYLSNQFLPGLGTLSGSLGATTGGKFDFSGEADHYFSVPVPVVSNSATWAKPGGGSWGNAGNWTGPVPQNVTDTAILGASITGDSVITLDGNRTVGRLTFNNAFKYTIAAGSPAGVLTIDDTGNTTGENPLISVLAGSHEISAAVSLFNGVNVSALASTTLTVSGAVGGVGNIVKSGGGVLALSGSNSFVGDLVTEGGVLQLKSSAAASSAAIILGDPATDAQAAGLSLGAGGLDITNTITTKRDLANSSNLRSISNDVADNNTISGVINVNGGVVLGSIANGTLTVTGVIQDGLDTGASIQRAIHVNGAGHVILTNAETATGDTFVDSGTLELQSGASLAGSNLNVFSAGVADIQGALSPTVKIYAQGKVLFPGNTTGSPATLNTATLVVDNGGLIKVDNSVSTANPVVLTATSVEFIGSPTNGQIDLTNNQLLTTNDQTTVRQQLQFANIITSRPDGTLGYKDNGDNRTRVQFAVAGDANLDGKVNTIDFNDLAGQFGSGNVWVNGDFNYDSLVDSLDFDILVANFGKTLPVASPGLGSVVPEPASAALLAVGTVGLLGRRRRD